MDFFRATRNFARHVRVLIRSALQGGRARGLHELRRTLHQAARAYQGGGLPALEMVLDSPGATPLAPGNLDWALEQADALAALLRVRPFRYCMRRTVLRYWVLRAAGRRSVFVIGAERNQELEGHAWIEMDGKPFREENDRPRRMTVVYRHEERMALNTSLEERI